MRNIFIVRLFGLLLLMSGCFSKYKFWDISKFNIKPNALKDSEEIKVIYTSQGPDNNKDLSYFIHLIVISQETGDTVNVLTTTNNGFEQNEGDKVFNFLSQDNQMANLIHSDLNGINDVKDLENLEKPDLSTIRKVARDPAFDYLADYKYPSTIGRVGRVTKGEDK